MHKITTSKQGHIESECNEPKYLKKNVVINYIFHVCVRNNIGNIIGMFLRFFAIRSEKTLMYGKCSVKKIIVK